MLHYVANLALVWAAVLVYRYAPYYVDFLRDETQTTLLLLAGAYTVFGFVYYLLTTASTLPRNKGLIVAYAAGKLVTASYHYAKNFTADGPNPLRALEQQEKVTLLFLTVKFFFLPLMLNFMFGNYFAMRHNFSRIDGASDLMTMEAFNSYYYPLLIAVIFLIDTAIFSVGYSFEAGFLRNKIRTVEPTMLGWIVVLASYPPFNSLTNDYLSWYANDSIYFGSTVSTFIARSTIVILFLVYLSATIALGPKSSNLTNRGIVTSGPYALIRHPAYICKNTAWWIMLFPVMSVTAFASMFGWSFIYFLRAMTEERHLGKDPDYQEYRKKVRHRFIPFVV
jgi:protein-S-isoprenylcysteine O-methyltransferase Ste14